MELFTVIFLVFMVGSGEQVLPTLRSEKAFPEETCWHAAKHDAPLIEAEFESEKGLKVFVVGMCIPEERHA